MINIYNELKYDNNNINSIYEKIYGQIRGNIINEINKKIHNDAEKGDCIFNNCKIIKAIAFENSHSIKLFEKSNL